MFGFHDYRFCQNLFKKNETNDDRRQMVNNIHEKRFQYSDYCRKIEEERKKLVIMQTSRISVQILETVFERMPQYIMQLSFVLGTLEYNRLKFLTSLQKQLNIDSMEFTLFVLIVIFGISFWSIMKTLIEYK